MAVVEVEFPGNIAKVESAVALRALPSSFVADGAICVAGNLGVFGYQSASLAPDDGQTVLKPDDKTPLQAGRWVISGGNVFVRNPVEADAVASEGVAPLTAQQRLDELEVYAQLKDGNTPAQNLAAIKTAISYTPAGGTMVLPKGDFVVDCLSGFSSAAIIDKRMTVRVDGRLRMNDGGMNPNPPCLLRVDADNVTLEGNGTLQGDGSTDSVNDGTSANYPRIVDVTGVNFVMRGLTIAKPPKVGLFLRGAAKAKITQNDFLGGPAVYTDTAHFAIRTEGGSGHTIQSNNFDADETGGKPVQCIFSGGPLGTTPGLVVTLNRARPWEKLCYLFGNAHRVTFNEVNDALKTDVFRIEGSYCSITDNFGTNCTAVCTIYDGHDNVVARNRFDSLKQTGVVIGRLASGYVGGFDRTRIVDNVLRADASSGTRANGIQVYIEGSNSAADIDIIGNAVSVFADNNPETLVLAQAVAPASFNRLRINGNKLSNGVNAIIVRRATRYEVRDNNIDSTVNTPIITSDGATGLFEGNRGLGSVGVPGIAGFNSASDTARNNQWTDDKLQIAVTIPSGQNNVSVTLPSWVANNAEFTVTRTNTAAGANGKYVTAVRAGSSLTVGRSDGTNATADETYLILVSQ